MTGECGTPRDDSRKVWEIVNRAREPGDIESRLTELERVAGARSNKTVRIG